MKDFFMKAYFKDGRIPGGGIGGNINFAENITLSRFVIYIERENIGDPAFTPIITVKQGDFAVADKDDIDCTVRRFLFLFDQRDQLPDFFPRNPSVGIGEYIHLHLFFLFFIRVFDPVMEGADKNLSE